MIDKIRVKYVFGPLIFVKIEISHSSKLGHYSVLQL